MGPKSSDRQATEGQNAAMGHSTHGQRLFSEFTHMPHDTTSLFVSHNRLENSRRRKSRRRGAAAAEFAVVLPVFMLVVFGIFEFGRMIMVQQVLTNASREGARLACIDGSSVTDVQSAVNTYLINASISGVTVNVTPNPLSNATPGSQVTVATSVPFADVSWVSSGWFTTDVTLSSNCVMRREGIP